MTIWNGNIKGIGNVRPIFGGREWDMRTYIYIISSKIANTFVRKWEENCLKGPDFPFSGPTQSEPTN